MEVFRQTAVTAKCKKTDNNRQFAIKKQKKWIANAQNNTLASSKTQADASACKRVVFLPTHTNEVEYYKLFLMTLKYY